jgi:hypothetical protein
VGDDGETQRTGAALSPLDRPGHDHLVGGPATGGTPGRLAPQVGLVRLDEPAERAGAARAERILRSIVQAVW